jgi:hypothetical protein
LALWLTYAAVTAAAIVLARRVFGRPGAGVGLLLALLPLLFSGKAMATGSLYGPADLYYGEEPWKHLARSQGIAGIRNPILSDVAFQAFPWRAAVFAAARERRLPLWNRFLLAGNPLLGAAQAGVFHPGVWLSLHLPLPLSFTFSATFTIFLSLLTGFLFFSDFGLADAPGLLGAAGFAFSTLLLFWNEYAEGVTLAALPLLLLAARRMAREPGRRWMALSTAALLLSLSGGQPEMTFFSAAAAAVVFAVEVGRGRARRALAFGLLSGVLALCLSAPLLLPVLEAIRNSSEYRARSAAPGRQAVPLTEAVPRLLPAVLPFSHGIYGRSPVQAERHDGSGMPFAYAGSVLFPFAVLGLARRSGSSRDRGLFLGFAAAGLLLGSSVPVVMDLVSLLPGFSLAHNYRLVFLAGLGLSGLAALGAARAGEAPKRLAAAAALTAVAIGACFLVSRRVFAERALPPAFVAAAFAVELAPLVLLAAAAEATRRRAGHLAAAGALLLCAERAFEMGGTYPTLPARDLAPELPTLASLPRGRTAPPYRVVGLGDALRPNASALYGLEDVRGYESIALGRFTDTFPLWCRPQWASFNRVDSLDPPLLSFLNVRFAVAPPEAPVPSGWTEAARGPELALFENPKALPRAFVPSRLAFASRPADLLQRMQETADFGELCWLTGSEPTRQNGPARVAVLGVGPDLLLRVDAAGPAFVATSVPDWPGWRAETEGREIPTRTVNHAFVGFFLEAGRREVRLTYRPASFRYGLVLFAAGILLAAALSLSGRLRLSGRSPGPAAS